MLGQPTRVLGELSCHLDAHDSRVHSSRGVVLGSAQCSTVAYTREGGAQRDEMETLDHFEGFREGHKFRKDRC